jgi:hypothetical protein
MHIFLMWHGSRAEGSIEGELAPGPRMLVSSDLRGPGVLERTVCTAEGGKVIPYASIANRQSRTRSCRPNGKLMSLLPCSWDFGAGSRFTDPDDGHGGQGAS